LFRQLTTDRHAGAADRANQIPAASKFPDLELLAKSKVAEPFAAGAAEDLDFYVTTDPDLVEGHCAVDFQIGCKGVWHVQ
jgi:hypothetical protein